MMGSGIYSQSIEVTVACKYCDQDILNLPVTTDDSGRYEIECPSCGCTSEFEIGD